MPTVSDLALLADQVLVKPLRQVERFERKSPSGLLFLPDQPERDRKREFFWEGLVVAVGPGDRWNYGKPRDDGPNRPPYRPVVAMHDGSERFPMHVKPGDHILYDRRPWGDIVLDGQEYTVLHEEQHIAAVIE